MNATPPLSLAELLTSASAGLPASQGGAHAVLDELLLADGTAVAADPRIAATFAALLQGAELSAEAAKPTNGRAPAADEQADERTGAAEAPASAIDTLLFLANLQSPAMQQAAQQAATNVAAPSLVALAARPANAQVADHQPVLSELESPEALAAVDAPDIAETTIASLAATAPPAPDAVRAGAPAVREASLDSPRALTATHVVPAPEPFVADGEQAAPSARGTIEATHVAPAAPGEPASLVVSPTQHAHGTPPATTVDVATPVGDARWQGEVAERVVGLVTRGVERAELRLSPAELGPVEVRIDVRGGEASLAIVAAQATTREALEQALPALREMLAQQGLSLGEATVRDGRADAQAGGRDREGPQARFDAATREDESVSAPSAPRVRRLVDTFA